MSRKIGEIFVQEFVLGFGFLSGFWIHVGIDPESEVLKALSAIIQTLAPNSRFSLLFWVIPIASTIFSIIFTYLLGGWIGLIAVVLAFLGGVFIESSVGVILLIVAILLGMFAPSTKERQNG